MYRTDQAGQDPRAKENGSQNNNEGEYKRSTVDVSDLVFYISTAVLALILAIILWSVLGGS